MKNLIIYKQQWVGWKTCGVLSWLFQPNYRIACGNGTAKQLWKAIISLWYCSFDQYRYLDFCLRGNQCYKLKSLSQLLQPIKLCFHNNSLNVRETFCNTIHVVYIICSTVKWAAHLEGIKLTEFFLFSFFLNLKY